MSLRPRSSATRAQPIRPPTGPEPIVKIGRSAPIPSGTMPPWHCMMWSSAGEADVGQATLHPVQVGAGDRADVRVDQGGDEALVLADRLRDLDGDRDEDVGRALAATISRARRSWAALRTDQRKAIAIVSTPAATSASAATATAASSSSTTTSPSESIRSATPRSPVDRDQRLGLAGFGEAQEVLRRLAGRPAEAAHRRTVSSKPRVVISPIAAPLRSTTMLVATVEPCEISRSIFV